MSDGGIGASVSYTVLRRLEHPSGKAIKAIMRDLRLSRGVVCRAFRALEADINTGENHSRCENWGRFKAVDTLLEEDEARVV